VALGRAWTVAIRFESANFALSHVYEELGFWLQSDDTAANKTLHLDLRSRLSGSLRRVVCRDHRGTLPTGLRQPLLAPILRFVDSSRMMHCALVIAIVAPLFATGAAAQSILITEHRGRVYPVVAASGSRPYVEVDGKRVIADGDKFGLRQVPEFLPAFVAVRGLKVNTSSLNIVENGQQINNEFHFRAEFESAYALKDVFLGLELSLEDGTDRLFLYEIGELEPHQSRSLVLVARTGSPLGSGNYRFHLFSGGLEILHSEMPFATREAMLDGLIARRIEKRPDGPPSFFVGPAPEYPAKLKKNKTAIQVVVRVRIRSTGAVLEARVVKPGEPALDEAALGAVRQWRFLPKIKEGRPIESVASVPIDFAPDAEPNTKH
jgi:TonB family protein